MHQPIDYYLYAVRRRHEEDVARAARLRQLPRHERAPSRWRSLVAALLRRLADRVAGEPAAPPRWRAQLR